MLIEKITHGFVAQVFDTEKNCYISQKFVAGYDVDYEDKDCNPIELEDRGNISDFYLPFEMVQP